MVGLQKLAAANSNVATRHLLQALLYLTVRACENISLRISDSIQFPTTYSALQNALSRYNTATLEELTKVSNHDFGIYINLEPDEEEKAMLEQNIQIALKTQSINLEDAIDIREVRNLKLANQVLKQRTDQKEKEDQQKKERMIQVQAQANAQQAQKSAEAEMQKQQALAASEVQVEKAKSEFKINEMQRKAEIDKQLLQMRYDYDIQLAQMKTNRESEKESLIEDRKDKRIKLEGTQQSEMIAQRQNDSAPIDFETPEALAKSGIDIPNV